MTNFEYIAANPAALAWFMYERRLACENCPAREKCEHPDNCMSVLAGWLKKQSEDE